MIVTNTDHRRLGFDDNPNPIATTEYLYDPNGNMTRDDNKRVRVKYNHLNKPTLVEQLDASGNPTGGKIEYYYDATGTKLRQVATEKVEEQPGVFTFVTKTTDYIAGFHYTTEASQSRRLDFFAFSEGRVIHNANGELHYQYDLKDHLGNVRASFREDFNNPGTAQLTQTDSYYPFGMQMGGLSDNPVGGEANGYLYNGKEQQTALGLGWYDYGARMYNPTIGRWNGVDVLADKYDKYSVYNYTLK
jgi:RHS repeat-associated protein